jgi:hypothetical protein
MAPQSAPRDVLLAKVHADHGWYDLQPKEDVTAIWLATACAEKPWSSGIRHNRGVFNFGMPGYRPEWLSSRSQIATVHGTRLARLAGRRLTRALVVWDLDEDEWFPDCPVLLDFEGEQVEINHWKFDEVSITWNTIDPERSPVWADFPLTWRDDVPEELAVLTGRSLSTVELLEWRGRDIAQGTVSLGFGFPDGQVTIYNALDENGMEFTPPDERYTRHGLGTSHPRP